MGVKRLLKLWSIPLLFYKDQELMVFRNFCCFDGTGIAYKLNIPKQSVGKALEYKMDLDKYLKIFTIFTLIVLYLFFITKPFSLARLLGYELFGIILIQGFRAICSKKYSKYLISQFGLYRIIEFNPPLKKEKLINYSNVFISRFFTIIILLLVYFIPMLFIPSIIKANLNSNSEKKCAVATFFTKLYLVAYPKTETIYDLKAITDYKNRKYDEALKDYKTVLKMSGRKFSKKDYVRLANMMLIQKWLTNPNDAVELYNEYVTRKNTSTVQASKVLWIRSMFEIENKIDYSLQQDYNDMLEAVAPDDIENKFYILCDKAYISYISKNYPSALNSYNEAINIALNNKKYKEELKNLYAERGFTKLRLGNSVEANVDFKNSTLTNNELQEKEPRLFNQDFWIEKK